MVSAKQVFKIGQKTTVKELKVIAKEIGLKGYSKLKKDELCLQIDVQLTDLGYKANYNPKTCTVVYKLVAKVQEVQEVEVKEVELDCIERHDLFVKEIKAMVNAFVKAEKLPNAYKSRLEGKMYHSECYCTIDYSAIGVSCRKKWVAEKIESGITSDELMDLLNTYSYQLPKIVRNELIEFHANYDNQVQKFEEVSKPMRKHKIDKQISSNIDLTPFSNKRIKITKLEGDLYSIKSDLRLYKSEITDFIERFLKRKLTIKYIKGNCSCPSGYTFAEKTKETPKTVETIVDELIESDLPIYTCFHLIESIFPNLDAFALHKVVYDRPEDKGCEMVGDEETLEIFENFIKGINLDSQSLFDIAWQVLEHFNYHSFLSALSSFDDKKTIYSISNKVIKLSDILKTKTPELVTA